MAIPFVHDTRLLRVVNGKQAKDVHDRTNVQASLDSLTLEASGSQLKNQGDHPESLSRTDRDAYMTRGSDASQCVTPAVLQETGRNTTDLCVGMEV
jgi:hypothetical protein